MHIEVGSRVRYKTYVRPFEDKFGTVVDIMPDLDKKKRWKYKINPDEKLRNVDYVFRWHPYENPSGDPKEPMLEDIHEVIKPITEEF